MAAIALIGPDGAGKTTVTQRLRRCSAPSFKCLYMGINMASSNVASPTSYIVEYLKRKLNRKQTDCEGRRPLSQARKNEKGKAWAAARLAHRLADEWYRQLLSWAYQIRGHVVLYDRHFLFDFSLNAVGDRKEPFSERAHRWSLAHLYPRPGLVIYLDAPAQVLYARKRESSVEDLDLRRQAYIRLGEEMPDFVRIDATQPLDTVYSEVTRHIARFLDRPLITA